MAKKISRVSPQEFRHLSVIQFMNKSLCVFVLIALISPLKGAEQTQKTTMPIAGESTDQQLLFITTRIDAKSSDGKKTSTGTGFIISEKIDEGQHALFVVTCRHVVEGFDTATLSFTATKDDKPHLGNKCVVEINDLPKWAFFNSDPKIDVAVMPLVPILRHFESKGESPYFRALNRTQAPSSAQEEEISVVQQVQFVGYPSGIRDEVNLLPITRRGITATPYQVDYNGLPLFLIDATVFGGSSGSPVVIFENGSFATGSSLRIGTRFHFLGLISQAYFHEEEGAVQFRALPSASVPTYKQRTYLNLGVVVKARSIFTTIDEYIQKHAPTK